ncbi:MAG: hypothetical protein ABIN48_06350 [Ginsengibacter sp.]
MSDKKPFSKYAIEIFQKAEGGKLELFTSSHSIATTHYLLKKYMTEKDLREVFIKVLDYLTVIAVDADIFKRGLRSSHIHKDKKKDLSSSFMISK